MRTLTTVAATLALTAAPALAADIEVVAELDQAPGNVTVTPDGRIIASQHQYYEPDLRVVEITPEGVRPFPTPEWAGPRAEGDTSADGVGLTAVLGLRSDANGIVWLLDNGGGDPALARLVGWDTAAGELHKVVPIPAEANVDGSFHNDLALDAERPLAYLADIAGGMAIVNLETGEGRRVLDGHESATAEDLDIVVRGGVLADPEGEPLRVGLNPITVSADNAHVYFGSMNGTSVYRLPTDVLADDTLSLEAVGERVERYGAKPPSDGITIDAEGNVYVTDLGGNAIGVTRPDGSYEAFLIDQRLEWPDGLSNGPDGMIYATVDRLNDTPQTNGGQSDEPAGPYYIVRFPALGSTAVGR